MRIHQQIPLEQQKKLNLRIKRQHYDNVILLHCSKVPNSSVIFGSLESLCVVQ